MCRFEGYENLKSRESMLVERLASIKGPAVRQNIEEEDTPRSLPHNSIICNSIGYLRNHPAIVDVLTNCVGPRAMYGWPNEVSSKM